MSEIKHHGTAGMKWGVWRSRSAQYKYGKKGGTIKKLRARLKPKKTKESVKIKSKNTTPKKTTREMSTPELQEKVNRIRLEKEYAKLTTPQQSTGTKFIKTVLHDSSKAVVTSGLIKAGNYYTDQYLKKYIYNK